MDPPGDMDPSPPAEPRMMVPWKHNTASCVFEKKDDSWFVVSQVPTDLFVQVEHMSFYVHKYALVSKSGYIYRIAAVEATRSEHKSEMIKLDKFPGGADIFQVVLKFCYGLPIDLSANNVAPLRCASDFLEMTEEFEDGNLISKTEAFLTFIVLSSWRDSIMVLDSCQNLSPWAENLQIVRRCCDSISLKACSQDRSTNNADGGDETWWHADVATLRIDHFIRIMSALRAKQVKPEVLGSAIMQYAERWLPGMSGGRSKIGEEHKELQLCISSSQEAGNKEQRIIIESLISILPTHKDAVPCQFLLWMLRMAMIYSVTPALITELEKRAGIVLQEASVKDLLIPSCGQTNRSLSLSLNQEMLLNSPDERTMHDTDVVQRILEYFLMHEQLQEQQQLKFEKFSVSKLLDSYLAEIAKDPNLSIAKFQVLAESLPQNARVCHDGLYRAIDTYLKSHPLLSDQDRRRLCKIMSCEKLSLDACMHAAQNDRLPLKTIVQVLFSEQVKMRTVMQGKEQATNDSCEQAESWSSTKREVKSLKEELDKVKTEMAELQRDYTDLQREYAKLVTKRGNSGWNLGIGWKKIRSSALFNRKIDIEENARPETLSQQGNRVTLGRRLSMA